MQFGFCKFGCAIRLAVLPEEPVAMLPGKNWQAAICNGLAGRQEGSQAGRQAGS